MTKQDSESEDSRIMQGPPAGYFVIENRSDNEAPMVDVLRAFTEALSRWRNIAAFGIIGIALAAALAWNLPIKYRAQVLVAPVKAAGGDAMGGLRSQVGGLAALAGIELGGGGRVEESFATLSSRGFAREFVVENNLLPALFPKRWDAERKKWIAGTKPPTIEQGVDVFVNVRTVTEDKRTRLITITVEALSPDLAANWANGLVDLVNERLRQDSIRDAEQNVKYLQQELAKTNIVELQQAIYRLMESQVNQGMLATVQRQYAFRVIDKAVPPERKSSPKRLSILLVGAFTSLCLSFGAYFVYYAIRAGKQKKLE